MTKQIIPNDQWQSFFGQLSDEYAQKLATLEMVPELEGPQLVTFDEPFGGITCGEAQGRTTLTIHLGEQSDLTLETPLRVHTEPFARGGGQIVEIEVAGMPLTRLYLAHSDEQSTGRGEIYGGAAERAVGQEAAPGRAYRDGPSASEGSGAGSAARAGQPSRGGAQMAAGDPRMGSGALSDFEGAGALGAGITPEPARGEFTSEADRPPADPPRSYLDEASRAAGIIGEANTGGGYGPPADRAPGGQRQAGGPSDPGDARVAGPRRGIGLGGVEGVGGGSLGDQDLSGRTAGERADLNAGELGDADVVDLGRGAGVLDSTRDPIGGTGDEDNGMDEGPDMVEGEVGAQAERDPSMLPNKRASDQKRRAE